MSGRRSRQKGKSGEREFAALLRKHGYDARRGVQYAGGSESPDVVCPDLPVHFEVKRRNGGSLKAWLQQCQHETKPGKASVVAVRADNEDWRVYMTAEDWLWLLAQIEARAK